MESFSLSEWSNLLVRWFHIFAGILWIGSTYYFTWLDGRLRDTDENKGQGWMVHSGGFYVVEAGSLDEAIELAAQIPGAGTGVVEVRPVMEFTEDGQPVDAQAGQAAG